jgi:adenine phosphoribosyltransferase
MKSFDLNSLDALIRRVPHFPHHGILFYDITSILMQPEAFRFVIDHMVQQYQHCGIEAIAGIEARGFLFAAPLADRLGIPFVVVRKAGKLPGATLKATYRLEYGSAEIEIHKDDVPVNKKVLIVDDLIATGGTLLATAQLLQQAGAKVEHIFGLVGLPFLNYAHVLKGYTVQTMLSYQNESID